MAKIISKVFVVCESKLQEKCLENKILMQKLIARKISWVT